MSYYAMDYDQVIETAYGKFFANGFTKEDADNAVWGIVSWFNACLEEKNAYLDGEWLQPAELIVEADVWGCVDNQVKAAKMRLSECVDYANAQLDNFDNLLDFADQCAEFLPVEEEAKDEEVAFV